MITFYNCRHLVLRYFRLRCTLPLATSTGESQIRGLYLAVVYNAIVDHVSIARCSTNFYVYDSRNVTVQHSLFGHPGARRDEDQSFGATLYHSSSTANYDTAITFNHNLFTHCRGVVDGNSRMPIEFLANVVYNWRYFGFGIAFVRTADRPAYQK
jgi:hypothetical protein